MRVSDMLEPEPQPVYREGAASMHRIAAALHLSRGEHGWRKYRSLLQPGNGRRVEIDRLQESMDHLVYEVQEAIEAAALREALGAYRAYLAESVNRITGSALYEFDSMLGPEALRARADRIAAELAAEAAAAPPPDMPGGQP